MSRPRLTTLLEESPRTAAMLGGALALLVGLLAYARRLSRRILALVEDVGAEQGADDEIGALSRRLTELIQRDAAQRAYLAQLPRILSHETLGPLGVVKMFLDDLEAAPSDGRHQAARRALRAIEALIEDLREATSLEDALQRGERVEVDLVALLRAYARADAEANAEAGGGGTGRPLVLELPDARFFAVVIEGRIEQLLDRLLDNARDFSDGAPVTLRARVAGDAAAIQVENRGPPLPEGAAREALFEPMHSGRKRTATRHLGLGLHVARLIAEQHGGGIRAWNAAGGRVVFEVTLRRAAAPAG